MAIESCAFECDVRVGERGTQHVDVRTSRVDCIGDRLLRRRTELELAARLERDAAVTRQLADVMQHGGEIGRSDATTAVVSVVGEPFQLEPDPRRVGGRVDGPITDEVQSVARGQAPRGRRHDGLSMPEVCRHPAEVADRCQPHVVASAHSRGARHHGLLRSGRRGRRRGRSPTWLSGETTCVLRKPTLIRMLRTPIFDPLPRGHCRLSNRFQWLSRHRGWIGYAVRLSNRFRRCVDTDAVPAASSKRDSAVASNLTRTSSR